MTENQTTALKSHIQRAARYAEGLPERSARETVYEELRKAMVLIATDIREEKVSWER